jgi:large subunit ribosomal protein L7e
VPTKDQILVPETLLKKRKSQEKAREQRSAEIEKRKKVQSYHSHTVSMVVTFLVMENTTQATRLPRVNAVAQHQPSFGSDSRSNRLKNLAASKQFCSDAR